MTVAASTARSTSPATLGLLVGLGGLLIAGTVGGAVGLIAGVVASRRAQTVLVAAVVALVATAAFTVLEEPLTEANVPWFPLIHPLADLAGKVAAVLLLAGLAGIVARSYTTAALQRSADQLEVAAVGDAVPERGGIRSQRSPAPLSRSPSSIGPRATLAVLLLVGLAGIVRRRDHTRASQESSPVTLSTNSSPTGPRTPRVPVSTIAAIAVAALLAAVTLWQIGDRRWEAAGPAVMITILGLAGVFALVERLRSRIPLRLAPIPGAAAILSDVRREHAHMLRGSMWLLAGTLLVSLGSFVFWLLVAQRIPADDVGRAAALFSASLFICYLTSLGLPIAVSRYASDRSQGSATLFAWSLVLTIASSLAGVAAFAAFAPDSIREGFGTFPPGLAWLVVFMLVAGLSLSVLVDVRLMALRRWSLVFLRACLIAVLRLPFLLWVPDSGAAFYVYAVAAGGFAVTGAAFLVLLTRRDWLRLCRLPTHARRAAQFAGVNYLGQLAVQAPFFGVPFVVLVQVDATDNAHFYLSWGVMSVVYISVQMIGQALLVEGGRDGADHRRQAAVALGAGLAVATAATLVSLGLGPLLATLYGTGYSPIATLLPLLVAGTIPFAVTTTLLTTARIREHSHATIAVAVAFAVAVLVPTMLLTARHGALGAAWGWTTGNAIAAALALLVSRVTGRVGEPARPATPLVTQIPGWQRAGRRG